MTTYLVTLIDKLSGKTQKIVVNSACTHGMQEYVNELLAAHDPGIVLEHPVVCEGGIEVIPAKIARQLMTRTTA
jgi:hypothetical protein